MDLEFNRKIWGRWYRLRDYDYMDGNLGFEIGYFIWKSYLEWRDE